MGVGRENITGVMPLFLFKEHWEFARRKAPPIYGFLCTIDIMVYDAAQYFNVPYMVLLRAIQKARDKNKAVYTSIEGLVLETCKPILGFNELHRNIFIKQLTNFYTSPEFRTIDIVASITVMLA